MDGVSGVSLSGVSLFRLATGTGTGVSEPYTAVRSPISIHNNKNKNDKNDSVKQRKRADSVNSENNNRYFNNDSPFNNQFTPSNYDDQNYCVDPGSTFKPASRWARCLSWCSPTRLICLQPTHWPAAAQCSTCRPATHSTRCRPTSSTTVGSAAHSRPCLNLLRWC